MKITLVNNTAGEFPLIGGIPNLGPYAKQVLEITTVTFESLKIHLDSMMSKGLLSYSTDLGGSVAKEVSSQTAVDLEPTGTKNALQLLRTELDTSSLGIEARFAKLEQGLIDKVSELDEKLSIFQTTLSSIKPLSLVYRIEAANTVSMSRQGYEPVNGTEILAPYAGTWLVLLEIGIYSPVATKGQIALGRFGSGSNDKIYEGSERFWVRSQETTSSVISSVSLTLNEGDKLSIYWKATEGVLRGTYRSITLFKI